MESHAFREHRDEILMVYANWDYKDDVQCLICKERYYGIPNATARMVLHIDACGGLVEHIIQACIFDERPLPF